MIRTRDFLLFVVTIVFLLVGIGVTVWQDISSREPSAEPIGVNITTPPPSPDSEVLLSSDTGLDRAKKLAAMREKVAERRASAPDPVDNERDALPTTTSESVALEATSTAGAVERCDTYSASDTAWPTQTVSVETREGATVVVYEEIAQAEPTSTTSQASSSVQVFWQLPVPQLAAGSSCIDHAVVGVAFDGLPLRNDEADLYSVFRSETLVGYARDGFPIYGTNDAAELDECGGVMTPQGYRYYLSSERETILSCFSGTPASLPSEYGDTGV